MKQTFITMFGLLPFLAACPLPVAAASPEAGAAAPPPPAAVKRPPVLPGSPEDWRLSMTRAPLPKTGCFTAKYPDTKWQEVPCGTAPLGPHLPATGIRPPGTVAPEIVGNTSGDYTAQVSEFPITSATGSFLDVTGLVNEASSGPGTGVGDSYDLQINTNYFLMTPESLSPNPLLCNGFKDPSSCTGWQQFIFSNSGTCNPGPSCVFIQYWLLNYYNNCPQGWGQSPPPPAKPVHCFQNAMQQASVPFLAPEQNLQNLALQGQLNSGGTDRANLFVAGTLYSAPGTNALNLNNNWSVAEFNVFGNGGGAEASFNVGMSVGTTTIDVMIDVEYGSPNAPSVGTASFTKETNSLNLIAPACPIAGQYSRLPTILFRESNVAGAASPCTCPTGSTWSVGAGECVCSNQGQGNCNPPMGGGPSTDCYAHPYSPDCRGILCNHGVYGWQPCTHLQQ